MKFRSSDLSLKLFFALIIAAVLLTLFLYDAGYYLAGSGLGYEMEFEFLGTRAVENYETEYDRVFTAAGGLIALVFQVLFFYTIIFLSSSRYLLGFLFFPLVYRVLPYLIGLINYDIITSQSEYLLSIYSGLPLWLMLGGMLLIFAVLNIHARFKTGLSWKRFFQGILFSLLTAVILMLAINFIR